MEEYEPRGNRVYAYQVTRENAQAAAKEFGCEIREEAKPGDPTDVAMWIVVPMINGTPHLLISHEGPVVGRERDTNRLVAWAKRSDFECEYQPVRKAGHR
ncbi:hypothetical protein ABZX73_06375 [Brevibacterium casei]